MDGAKALLPPQDEDEVLMAVRAGNEVVPLLAFDPSYSADEACQCIRALVKIGTPAAMQMLVDYAKATFESDNEQHSIGNEIGRGWDIFDRTAYLSNVLSYLRVLDLEYTEILDIGLLSSLTLLRRLDLNDTQVTDILPLRELTQLTALNLSNTQVTDISPLRELTQLTELNLINTQVTDISPLKHLSRLRIFIENKQKTNQS